MASDIDDKLSDLRSAQIKTHTLVEGLTEKVDKYIDSDNLRHQDLMDFRLKASEHLASVATIVQDMKKEVDCTVNETIPKIQKKQSSQEAQLKSHSWLIRAIVGVTLLAVLGGTVTSLTTCESVSSSTEAVADSDGDEE